MLKKLCLTMLFVFLLCGLSHAAAAPDPFDTYMTSVKGLNLENEDDQQKAGKALLILMQSVMKIEPTVLGELLQDEFFLNGKEVTKKSVAKNLKKVFPPHVVQSVLASDPTEEIMVKGDTDYGFAGGCIWVNFVDDKPQNPVIFAVTTGE